jgi:DNA (cytosine-5)-methyltransferase 1
MTIGSLFSGIGGLELGLERAGHGPVRWQVEINPFCRRVLAKHWPDAERFGDVRAVGVQNLAPVRVICGGFPCQDVSQARSARPIPGLAGEQSSLWAEFARIVHELRPRAVVVENVASGKQRWLPQVRRDLHLLGYGSSAVEVAAEDVGGTHARRRIFVVGHPYANSKPVGPIDVEVAELSPDARTMWNGWLSEPRSLRMDDGVPGGVDRVRALGNAVVPQCAEVVGRMLSAALRAGEAK